MIENWFINAPEEVFEKSFKLNGGNGVEASKMFINLIQLSPVDRGYALDAMGYIVEEGTGGRHLDEVHKKNFRMTTSEYINVLKKSLEDFSQWVWVYKAISEWYGTFEKEYQDLNINQLKSRWKTTPIHTWVHFLLNGELHRLRELDQSEMILVEKETWERTHKLSLKKNLISNIDDVQDKMKNHEELKEELIKLYRSDEDTRVKVSLLDKKLALFLDTPYDEAAINEYKQRYNLQKITQYSSIELTEFSVQYDIYVFLGKRATHAAFNKLKSKISRERLLQVSGQNIDMVFNEITQQLKGKIDDAADQ